jgi:hypothetical protein
VGFGHRPNLPVVWEPNNHGCVCHIHEFSPYGAFVNGMLHFIVQGGKNLMAQDVTVLVSDVEENKRKIIHLPLGVGKENYHRMSDYVGQSQGRLHYMYRIEGYAEHAPSELSSNVIQLVLMIKKGSSVG